MIQISTTGYVKTKLHVTILHLVEVLCVPAGKTRTRADGTVEALFMVISPRSNHSTVWLTRADIY